VAIVSLAKTERVETVYNLEVADWNTYFVGEAAVWVHNNCFPKDPSEIARLFNTSVKNFHGNIKPALKADFASEIRRTGASNPDVGVSSTGTIMFKNVKTGKTVDTGVLISSYWD
jgi:hypothetical protein